MKLSFWQQFGSNHSTSYSIVGVFETSDTAQEAHDTLYRMMWEIIDSHREPDNENEPKPSVEQQYADLYGIEWEEPIDWLRATAMSQEEFRELMEDHLRRFGQHVIVDSDGDSTWQTGDQFKRLLAAMGAQVYARINYEGLRYRLECTAPSTDVAQHVYEGLHRHLTNFDVPWEVRTYDPAPWAIYHPLFQRFLPEITLEQYRAAEQVWHFWEGIIRQHANDDDAFLWRQMERLAEESTVIGRMYALWEQSALEEGTVTQDGLRIIFEEKEGGTDLMDALPALHAWLNDLDCVITYEFQQVS